MAQTRDAPETATIDTLKALIGFDTVSRNSNLALIDWAADRLEAAGARVRFDYNSDRSKANLIATFGQGEGGIVLSGHTDVVPVDGQQWTTDPFCAVVRDGRVYGRGASDMKGFIAVILSAIPALAAATLREPVHVALSYDEELGCLGIPGLLREMQRAGIAPTGCIVGEPTNMRVVSAHKGGRIYKCRVHGHAAHASLTPQGVNAIEYAARLIAFIQSLAAREEQSGGRDDDFDVPFSTISTNLISGGNGHNIIPALCEFTFEYRHLPSRSSDVFIDAIERFAREELVPEMTLRHADCGIEFETLGKVPALEAQPDDEILKLALALARPGRAEKVAYGTEASFFQEVGVPSVVCGPGSIEQAHKPDEFVTLAQLAACEDFVAKLVEGAK